jgi:hypothetical protein
LGVFTGSEEQVHHEVSPEENEELPSHLVGLARDE